jgi:hypothetical protein
MIAALREMADDYAGSGGSRGEHIQPGPYAKLRHAYLQRMEPADLMNLDLEIGEGERHYTLMSLAGLLHDGERTAEDIADILEQVRPTYLTEREIVIEVSNIASYAVCRELCTFEPRELPAARQSSPDNITIAIQVSVWYQRGDKRRLFNA